MPGPMADCARSTGAMLDERSSSMAACSSRLSAITKSRRVPMGAPSGRLRHTSTMEDARAFLPEAIFRLAISVRIGQVPVIEKPARMMAESIVSQPVEAVDSTSFEVSVSLCLKA